MAASQKHGGVFLLMNDKQSALNVFSAYINLIRVRIVCMVMVSCAIGFVLAYRGEFLLARFLWTLLGTALLSGGSCTLNCYQERKLDALMPRTCHRPIPSGVIAPLSALIFGVSLVLAGAALLFTQCNFLACLLGLTAVVIYLGIYTPAKRLTWLNTSIGSIPGAIPPLIGWASASGTIDAGGWILFAMLFVWQHVHFFPIAWLYRDDYRKAGFQMLPVLEANGEKTFRFTLLAAIALLPISLLLHRSHLTGMAYLIGSVSLGILFIAAALHLSRRQTRAAARTVLIISLFYLPMILGTVMLDRYGGQFLICMETVWRWT